MNRRSLLTASTVGALFGVSGCLEGLESLVEGSDDEAVPDCTHQSEWDNDITTGPADPDIDSIAGRRNCATADRPEPTGDVCAEHVVEASDYEEAYVSIGVTSYPELPSTFDDETVTTFVEEYERAYSQNELVHDMGDRVVEGGARIDEEKTEVLDIYEDITVVRIDFSVSYTEYNSGGIGATDPTQKVAVYGVDETGLVRAAAEAHVVEDSNDDGLKDSLNPVEDGDLLKCF